MPDELFNDASWLIAAIMRGLMTFPDETPGVHEVLSRIAEQDLSEKMFSVPQAQRLPGCRHLPEAVAAGLVVSSDLCSAIATIEDRLHWTRMDHYADEVMGQPGFEDNGAYAEIVGPTGFFAGDDFGLGLVLLGPGMHCIDHHHAAPELYWLLSGPIEYRRPPGSLEQVGTSNILWNKPNEVHAMKTGERPMLAVWSWTRDVDQLPVLVSS